MKDHTDSPGTALVFALVTSILLVTMAGSLALLAANESEVALGSRYLEAARFVAETGLNLVVEDYEQDQAPPPQDWYDNPQAFAGGTYQIVSDVDLVTQQRRRIVLRGVFEDAEWRIEAIIGPESRPVFGAAIQANDDVGMGEETLVDSYDSGDGPYGGGNRGSDGDIQGNGDFRGDEESAVKGDVQVKGNISGGGGISGDAISGGPGVTLDSVDPLVDQVAADLSGSNDNGTLDPSIVGPGPSIGVSGSKTISSGDYYVTEMSLGEEAMLVLDTTGGPIQIVIHSGDFSMSEESSIEIVGDNPVTIYMSGNDANFDMDEESSITNNDGRADLFGVVMKSNTRRFLMDEEGEYYGTIWAPDVDVDTGEESTIYGAIIGRGVAMDEETALHYDVALAAGKTVLVLDSYRVHFKKRDL